VTPQRRVLRWVLLVAQAACLEPAGAPPDPVPVALLTPDVWSGGEAVLTSAAFTAARGLPVVLLNDDTQVVRRLDDTTVAARLPDLPGTQSLRVLAPDVLDLPIAIELRGFESAGWGPLMGGRVQPLPGWPPSVVGSGVSEAVVWNLQSTITLALPDSLHDPSCSRGVGPSYAVSGVALVARCDVTSGNGRWWSWRLRPSVQLLEDSLCATGHFVAEMAPGREVSVGTTGVSVSVRDGLTCAENLLQLGGTYDVVISPRGDRAVIIRFSNSLSGVTVLDVETGQVVYEVAQIRGNSAAAFSAEGETLFVAGGDAAGQQVLLALRAADGQLLRAALLPLDSWAIALDPSRPWLYVNGYQPGYRGQVLVFDRDSLALLATVGVPDSVSGLHCCDVNARIVPSPAEQRLYIVWTPYTRDPADRAFLTRFRTPP
jgi:hypothetical protein